MKKRDLAIFDKLSKSEILKQQKTASPANLNIPSGIFQATFPKGTK